MKNKRIGDSSSRVVVNTNRVLFQIIRYTKLEVII